MTIHSNHPITPPPELVHQWIMEAKEPFYVPTQAAHWGADKELEACLRWFSEFYCMETWMNKDLEKFRAARRPKPPSLKEQALALLGKKDAPVMLGTPEYRLSESEADTIRRALEQLDD